MKSSAHEKGAPRQLPFLSIFTKVLCAFLLMALSLIVLTNGFNQLFLERYTVNEQLKQLSQKAAYISGLLSTKDSAISITFDKLYEIESLTDAKVIYIDSNLLARFLPVHQSGGTDSAEFELRQIIDTLDMQLFQSLLNGQSTTDMREVEFLDAKVLFAGAPLYTNGNALSGAILLYRPFQYVSGILRNSGYITLLSCLSAGVISILLSFILSRYLTGPLRLINRTAKRMAEGVYDEQIHLNQRDEIGQLGSTLNLLATRLSHVISNLKNEKSKMEQIIAGIGEGIIAFDRDLQIVHHNAAALELLELRSLPGSIQQEQEGPLFQLYQTLDNCIANRENAQFTWENSSKRIISTNIWLVCDDQNQPNAAVVLLRDVSEEQRLEQLRRDYVANVSHELRTPLTGIRGMVEPLLDGIMETEEEKQDCYQVIYQETLRLQKLIGEMLNMSRLQDGRVTIDAEPLEISGILEAAVKRLHDRAEAGGVSLLIQLPESQLPLVLGSEDHILQVLIIFLDNALSFTPSGGCVTLYARCHGEKQMCIGVRDTGSGIDPKDLPYIWERFYKADRSRLHTTGTGLGLSIAKLTVEHMNGQVRASSSPGEGATFEIFLPLAENA